MMHQNARPLIVGVGGTMRDGSTSERLLRAALSHAEKLGASTRIFSGPDLDLPAYAPGVHAAGAAGSAPPAAAMIEALRRADGVIISSPGYHGSFSGLIKNALDFVEDMRSDSRVYFEDRAVGLIVSAAGAQAIGSTLGALRSVVHALRGWPTPLGIGMNTAADPASGDGEAAALDLIPVMVEQVIWFAKARAAADSLRPIRAAV